MDDHLWHRQFGHICGDVLNKAVGIMGSKKFTISMCDVYAPAKQGRNSCSETRDKAECPHKIIHTATIGPLLPSHSGDKYVLTFLDDCVTFTLKSRSKVLDAFIEFKRNAIAKFNTKIHKVRCDNALEYVAGKTSEFYEEKGIVLQPSEPYLHEHNSPIERMNRRIKERAIALLYDAKLPKIF